MERARGIIARNLVTGKIERFATDGGALFFIDNIVVKQTLKAGAQVSRLENSAMCIRDR